ncbi:MAG: transglutaminase domain-containing protein [Clostridia bacterium]|nr:transglutaminase domain-containing protein [Clostridia bacterium]
MTSLDLTDCKTYLKNGSLSQPFLADEIIQEKIEINFINQLKTGHFVTEIEGLIDWLHHMVKHTNDRDFIKENQFQRSAQEIWASKVATGCTDYALLFATCARQLGIPTTLLHTAEFNWIERLKAGEDSKLHYGHSFCECFYNGKWILVDPTCRKIMYQDYPKKLELDYNINGNSVFIPYFRGLDLGKKQSIQQHNEIMDKECIDLNI